MGQSIDTQSPQHTEDSTAQGYYTKPSGGRQRRVAVSVIEGRERGVGGEERLFVLLHRMREVERTCLLRACVNQQLAGPREDRETDREGERGCPGRVMEHAKQQMARDGVRCPFSWVKHDGSEGWRETREERLQTLSLMTKPATAHTHTHTRSFNTLTESNSHLLYALICPCHTYEELVSRSMNSPSHPSEWPPSAACASWFRPAVAALAASGADPSHLNASDINLGRTTWGRGGGGETTFITDGCGYSRCKFLSQHPCSRLRYPSCCVLLRRPCVQDVCVVRIKWCCLSGKVWVVMVCAFFFLSQLNSGSLKGKTV